MTTNVFNNKEFKFVSDDIFLCPFINPKTAEMYLIIKKVDLNTGKVLLEDKLFCTHTVITEITDEEFWYNDKNTVYSEEFQKSTLKIRSEGGLREIELSLEDNIFAFNSWVEDIAIAGSDALRIQADIEKYANLMYPMVLLLHRFLAKAHDDYIFSYLAKVERECVFEGVKHESSLIANLVPLVKTFAICPWETEWEFPDCPEGYYREEEGYYFKNNIKEILTYVQDLIPLEKIVDRDKILLQRFDIALTGEIYHGKLFVKEDAQFLRDIEKQIGRPVNMWDLSSSDKELEKIDTFEGYVMTAKNYVVAVWFEYVEEYYTPDSVSGLKHLDDEEFVRGYF